MLVLRGYDELPALDRLHPLNSPHLDASRPYQITTTQWTYQSLEFLQWARSARDPVNLTGTVVPSPHLTRVSLHLPAVSSAPKPQRRETTTLPTP